MATPPALTCSMRRTPLHWACRGGHVAMVELLVAAGATKVCVLGYLIASKLGWRGCVRRKGARTYDETHTLTPA